MTQDLTSHLLRQRAFSRATFGPGTRKAGIIDHIRYELEELEQAVTLDYTIEEWTDLVILSLDGLWRACELRSLPESHLLTPEMTRNTIKLAVRSIRDKQSINEHRMWPDWRAADRTKAIKHEGDNK